MAGIILSADIGTSSLKAAFIDLDGRLRSFSRISYARDSRDSPADASGWEYAFHRALECLYGLEPETVPDAICISGNGPTLVPVTEAGDALPPLYWHDGKTLPAPEGTPLSFFLPRAAWFKENLSDLYKKTRVFLSSHEWLASRLGAEARTVLPSPSYEPYYWDEEQLRLFGLDRGKFPPFIEAGKIMGRLSKEAASRFGAFSGNRLKSGTPIVSGGPDFITALIGTGTRKEGDVCDRAGTSEGINVCAAPGYADEISQWEGISQREEASRRDFSSGVRILPHAEEGFLNFGVLIKSSGSLFESFRRSAGEEGRPYDELLAKLIPASGDAKVFESAFFPGDGRADKRLSAPPEGGAPLPEQSAVARGRAALCSIGFAVRSALLFLERMGIRIKVMRVSGGQAKNPLWNQLKADITGRVLLIPEIPDAELAGNAVLSAAALEGIARAGASERMIRFREAYEPRKEYEPFWADRYALYERKREGAAK